MKNSSVGNFGPLGANLTITFFEKLFDFLKAHIKRQLLVAGQYQEYNFRFFTPH